MLTSTLAKKYLRKIEEDKAFWIKDYKKVYSLEKLYFALKEIDKETFKHHVNKHKNDFERWIRDVIGDTALANQLSKTRTQKTTIRKLRDRLDMLKKYTEGYQDVKIHLFY